MTLTPEQVRAEWVAELRKPEAKQTKGVLTCITDDEEDGERPVGDCCLGVLCKLAVKHGIIDPGVETGDGTVSYDGRGADLSQKVQGWAGLATSDGYFIETGNGFDQGFSLAESNDQGSTFSEIADLIESTPPGLLSEDQ